MTYSDEEITRQLRLGEDSRWEFKEVDFTGDRPTGPQRDDWADEICAFANSSGGLLLCGVTDDGDVQGMSRAQMDQLELLIVEVCTDSIGPPIRVDVFRKESAEHKPFLVVEVPPGDALHETRRGSFIRVGSTKRQMSSDERLRLAQRRSQAQFIWFDKQTVPGTGFGTLDEVLWKPLLSVAGAADPEVALEKMALLALDEHGTMRATVAGVLLCCNTPELWLPNACITATRYRGIDRASGQIDAQTIGGPINQQVTAALTFVERNMQVAARKSPAREDLPQYSRSALFEALVNAVAHRDYSISGSRIRLMMFHRSARTLLTRRSAQQPHHREHGRPSVDSQRSADLRTRQVERRRDRGRRRTTVLHRTTRRRRADHPARDAGTMRRLARLSAPRRCRAMPHDSGGLVGANPGHTRHHSALRWRSTARGGRVGVVPQQDLEPRDDRREWERDRRFALHSSTDDGLRSRVGLQRRTSTTLDPRRGRACH